MRPWQTIRGLLRGERAGIPGEFVRFAMVGTLGFVADATVLTLLVSVAGWGPYESRPVSFLAAISLTWLLNRLFTFSRRAGPNRPREYARYLTVESIGALINFAVYAAVLALVPALERYPALALAAGSLTAMWFNFFGVRWFAFDRGGHASESPRGGAASVPGSPPSISAQSRSA